jgi:hypothetical protein
MTIFSKLKVSHNQMRTNAARILSLAALPIVYVNFPAAETSKTPDACKLLTPANIQQVQGSAPLSARASSQDTGSLASSQCFFTLSPFIQSVSLEVISQSSTDKINVRDFWNEKFHAKRTDDADADAEQKSHQRRKSEEDEEKKNPPQPLPGIGEDAFWVYTGRDGAVYTLQGKYIVRVGVSGKGDEAAKIQRASALAKFVLLKLE